MYLRHIEVDGKVFEVDKILELQDYFEVYGRWVNPRGEFATTEKDESFRIFKQHRGNWLVCMVEDWSLIGTKPWVKI